MRPEEEEEGMGRSFLVDNWSSGMVKRPYGHVQLFTLNLHRIHFLRLIFWLVTV